MLCLPDEQLRHSYVPSYIPDCLTGVVVNHVLGHTNKFEGIFLLDDLSEASKLQYLFVNNCFQILCNVLRLTSKHCEIFVLELPL